MNIAKTLSELQEIILELKSSVKKTTEQNELLISVLIEDKDSLLSKEDLAAFLKSKGKPMCSKTISRYLNGEYKHKGFRHIGLCEVKEGARVKKVWRNKFLKEYLRFINLKS